MYYTEALVFLLCAFDRPAIFRLLPLHSSNWLQYLMKIVTITKFHGDNETFLSIGTCSECL